MNFDLSNWFQINRDFLSQWLKNSSKTRASAVEILITIAEEFFDPNFLTFCQNATRWKLKAKISNSPSLYTFCETQMVISVGLYSEKNEIHCLKSPKPKKLFSSHNFVYYSRYYRPSDPPLILWLLWWI
jgi:hypothetical protein